MTSDRCEINRQIKADNALLRELKAQVRKLMQAVKATIPAMAEAMEKLRENMIVFRYQLRHISYGKGRLSRRLGSARSALKRYSGLVRQIKEKGKERFQEQRMIYAVLFQKTLRQTLRKISLRGRSERSVGSMAGLRYFAIMKPVCQSVHAQLSGRSTKTTFRLCNL